MNSNFSILIETWCSSPSIKHSAMFCKSIRFGNHTNDVKLKRFTEHGRMFYRLSFDVGHHNFVFSYNLLASTLCRYFRCFFRCVVTLLRYTTFCFRDVISWISLDTNRKKKNLKASTKKGAANYWKQPSIEQTCCPIKTVRWKFSAFII